MLRQAEHNNDSELLTPNYQLLTPPILRYAQDDKNLFCPGHDIICILNIECLLGKHQRTKCINHHC